MSCLSLQKYSVVKNLVRSFTMRQLYTSSLQTLLLLTFLRPHYFVQAQQNVTCFFPNGTHIAEEHDKNDYYQACPRSANNDGTYMCCKTASTFYDVCKSNGLCARPDNPGLGEAQGLLRSTCTDPSWDSPSCLKLCTNYTGRKIPYHEHSTWSCRGIS